MVGIQVDMFEVQLGAGLLLRFRTQSDRVIRILADAGMKGPYPKDHLHRKLTEAVATFRETAFDGRSWRVLKHAVEM